MYVFGGCNSSKSSTTFNDLWKIDLNSKRKTRLLTTGSYPSPKAYASMVLHENSLILIGGYTCSSSHLQHGSMFDELHVYDITNNSWTQKHSPYSLPPLAGHSSTVHGNVVIIFGGMKNLVLSNDFSNDIYCIDIKTFEWFKPEILGEKPIPRVGHTQIKVDDHHVLILSGCSRANHRQNDLWLLTIPSDVRSGVFTWTSIAMKGSENMPKQLFSYPACKFEDHVVVLARQNPPEDDADLPIVQNNQLNGHNHPRPLVRNGLGRPAHQPLVEKEEPRNSKPSIRPNACNNKEKRLMMLSKYENHIQNVQKENNELARMRRRLLKPSCCMTVYLLDISHVVEKSEAEWKPSPQWSTHLPPHPRVKSCLVVGKGELILCCGMETGDCSCNPTDTIPRLMYLKAPNTFS